MLVSDWILGVQQRICVRRRSRLRQRRTNHTSRVAAEISLLEERQLLSSVVLGPEQLLNTTTTGNQQFSAQSDRSFAVDSNGTMIVAWSAPGTAANTSNIVARRIDSAGSPLGDDFVVSTTTAGQRGNAVVGVAGADKFVVAWESDGNAQDTSGWGVFARVFSNTGTPLTGEFRINGTTTSNQRDPSVGWVSPDAFVVGWSGAGQGDNQNALARIFNAAGAPVTNEIRLNDFIAGSQQDTVVTSLPGAGFQAAWSGAGFNDTNGVFSRRFDSAGNPLGGSFRVNTANGATERQPTIARDGGNQVLIAWQSTGNSLDTSGTGIIARRFDLAGAPLGTEFLINQTTAGNQSDPSVAFLSDGRFVAAWQGSGGGDADGVYVRVFNADGTPSDGEHLANSTSTGLQNHPTVRAQGVGYVVAWDGNYVGPAAATTTAALATAATLAPAAVGVNDDQGICAQQFGQDQFRMPGNDQPGRKIGDVLFIGDSNIKTGPDGKPATKTITFYNNSDQMIYPVLEDANNPVLIDGKTYRYDPLDAPKQEYRGYVGYQDGYENGLPKIWVGLRPHQQIDVDVPLVFWDAGTIQILTVPDLFQSTSTFTYYDAATKGPAGEESLRYTAESINYKTGGRVMWYHAVNPNAPTTTETARNFGSDAPGQLMEFSIRDVKMTEWAPNIPDNQKGQTLFDYDVSYVQDMILPIAPEAVDVPVPNNSGVNENFGWNGSKLTIGKLKGSNDPLGMQDYIANFTADAEPGVSQQYLGLYFDGKGWDQYYLPSSLKAGQKIPANDKTFGLSPLGDVRSTYDSGKFQLESGGDAFQVDGQGTIQKDSSTVTGLPHDLVTQLVKGMLVKPSGPDTPLQQGTIIDTVDTANNSVTLTYQGEPAKSASTTTTTFTFVGSANPTRPIDDYVVKKLTSLWYSWADYYATAHQKDKIKYSAEVNAPTLSFTNVDTNLYPDPDKFAEKVYNVMNSFSKVPPNNIYLPATAQLLQNIVGCNTGKIPGLTPAEARALTIDVQSLLRSVVDHRVDKNWYQDPATKVPGINEAGAPIKYNPFNLDPFVWFVHKKLDLSGYGFSVDDETGNVNASNASHLLVSVGGLAPNTVFNFNTAEWSSVAQWGPKSSAGNIAAGGLSTLTIDSLVVANQFAGPDPNTGVLGAQIKGPGIKDGTTIGVINPTTRIITLSQPADPNPSGWSGTYYFKGPNQEWPA